MKKPTKPAEHNCLELALPSHDPNNPEIDAAEAQRILEALPHECRVVLRECLEEHRSFKEVAERYGYSTGCIVYWFYDGIRRINVALAEASADVRKNLLYPVALSPLDLLDSKIPITTEIAFALFMAKEDAPLKLIKSKYQELLNEYDPDRVQKNDISALLQADRRTSRLAEAWKLIAASYENL